METVNCPLCGEVLNVKPADRWQVIRTGVTEHLRVCDKAPEDERSLELIAVQIASGAHQELG
jgi:hypothetical protein